MRVVFTIDSFVQGGTEQSIADLIKNFSNDIEVTVIYFYPKHELLSTFQQLNIDIIFLDLKGKYDWVKGVKKLKSVLKKLNPDLVVSSLYRSNIISRVACKMTDNILIGTFVTDSYNEARRKSFKWLGILKYQITWLVDRMTSKFTYAWISNSKYIALQNQKKLGVSFNRVHVIYRGRDCTSLVEWKPITSNDFIFATIGRLYENKGYIELINAFSAVVNFYPNSKLIIYGEGPHRKQIEIIINQLNLHNYITLAGNVSKAWLKLHEAHCFIFPSRFEGFSGALVEAMMTGIPIIASDIPMNLEAVENEKTALIHQVKDSHDIANKMKQMIGDYDKMIEMGKRARKVAIEKFDIREIAVQYEKTLKRIVNENQKNS